MSKNKGEMLVPTLLRVTIIVMAIGTFMVWKQPKSNVYPELIGEIESRVESTMLQDNRK
ncbi:MAG: hypothetical protein GX829_11475 [Clostridium sp.]|nr:hypothetical protein [Clostridium sp.]